MKIRQKTLLLTILPLVGLVLILYGSLSAILLRSYTRLETQDADRNLQRVNEVLAGDLKQMHILAEDWAEWDETYAFVRTLNPDYIESNLADRGFESLKLNFLAIVDDQGKLIYGQGYDLEREKPIPLPESLKAQLTPGSLLLNYPHIAHYYTGLIPVDDQVLLIAAEPILRSDGTGPARGMVLMGRYLDPTKVEDLAFRTKLDLSVHVLGDQLPLPENLIEIAKHLQRQVDLRKQLPLNQRNQPLPTQIEPLNQSNLAGYMVLPDIYQNPRLLIQITLPRDIYQQGQISLHYLAVALMLACGVFIGCLWLLLERIILRRLLKLSNEVNHIGQLNDLTRRVPAQGSDELSRLGTCINRMLGELQVSTQKLALEQQKAERLLLNILPESIADQLMQEEVSIAQHFDEVTILFADIVGFTPLSSRMEPIALVNLLNRIFSAFDTLAEKFNLEKIKTIGDAYMVAAGLPLPRPDHAIAIAEMALAMQDVLATMQDDEGEAFQMRIGINTGVVVAGVIGTKKFIYDLWGDAVNIASRMESSSEPGMIQVTAATYEQIKDHYWLEERGSVQIKGRGEMVTYWLQGHKQPWVAPAVPIAAQPCA